MSLATDIAAQHISSPRYPFSLVDRRLAFAVPVDSVTITLPDSFIIANSETLRLGKTILRRGGDYQIDYRRSQLHWRKMATASGDSLILTYRVLPISLPKQLAIFQLSQPAKTDSVLPISNLVTETRQDNLSPSRDGFGANLSKSGSLTRGVSVGTDQGLKVDSGLRLQLAGKLSDKTEVIASLTDQSTPIQPEGNTQTLSEIDKVFVQLKSERFEATLGDFQIEYGGSEFSRYSRKLQGAKIAVGNDEQPSNFQLQLSAAVSRGKFTTNQFNGIEGRQGPYQLQGDRGQIDILILAGTERVWIDGQLMTRGENNDYIIEYSNGQITFTRKRLITSDSRITVDFQFSDERFRRNLYSAQGLMTGFNEKVKWQTTLLREGDDRDNPLGFTLTPQDRDLLAAAGDGLAQRDGRRFVGRGKGNYIRIFAQGDSIWIYTGPDSSGDHEVRFSDLGEGRGDYAYRGFGNFAYVGKNNGRYAPVVLLTPAQRQELLDSRLEVAPWRGVAFINEFAVSQLDRNLYSNRDDGDNAGRAVLSTLRIEPQFTKLGRLNLQARFRKKDSRYRDIDRTDVVEFNRRWNLADEKIITAEEMIESSAVYSPSSGWNLRGGYGKLIRGSSSGRWETGMDFKRASLPELQYHLENITRREAAKTTDSKWRRQRGSAVYSFWKLKPQFGYEGEDRRETLADTASGFRFNSYTAGLEAQFWRRLKLAAAFNQRDDNARLRNGFARKATAYTQNYALTLERWKALAADISFTHRQRRLELPQPDRIRADLADVRIRFAPYQRAIDTDWQYQITNTQTAKQERVFIKGRQGEGNYRFDANLNEYIPDLFGDHVLRVIPSENFVPVVELRGRSNIRVNFANLFRFTSPAKEKKEDEAKGWKDYLKAVTTETFIRIEEKTSDPQVWEIYKLKLSRFQNSQHTQFGVQSLRQDVNLWENDRSRSLRYRLTALRELNNQFLGEGLSRRNQLRHELRVTLALSPKLSSQSELIVNREDKTFKDVQRQNRLVRNRSGTVELSYRPRTVWELAVEAGAAFDEDRAAPAVDVRAISLRPRSTYSFRGKGRLSGEIEWVQVTLTPMLPARPLPFELANGNRPGRTLRWNFALEYRVSTNINLFASYLGRSEPARRTLHVGKVEMRAFF
ncbi:MAG: hypothetical protein ONB46_05265 [candidate division KSB1 bacterium]|nr:hypothetical protein [candidate division KSB1 bacterium]MDZ7365601.1 hypothetical protein [candidate division KSB1 bacterium]MDZ7403323.1 hypothetical protein [candidate division KSB1 bacterium]